MAFKKSAASAGPRVWTVAELGAFYTEHRSELLAHANRVLKDSAKAEEITQDAPGSYTHLTLPTKRIV